ncbi:hypothetical protein Tco_0804969 [Tanacetum coccineum]
MISNGMACFKELESHLSHLYHKNFFHELRLQFERKPLHANNAKSCLKKLQTQFQEFFDSEAITSSLGINPGYQEFFKDYTGCKPETYRSNLLVHLDILEKFIEKSVLNYGEIRMKENEVKEIKETDKPLNEAIPHKHEIEKSFKLQSKDVQINLVQAVDANLVVTKSSRVKSENNRSENALSKSVNETQMKMQEGKVDMGKALDDGSVITESNGTKLDKQDTSNRPGSDTNTEDAVIRPVNDQEPLAEVQLTAQHTVLANEQQHSMQSNPIYDTYLLKKVDRNTILDSTNMCHRGGEIDQNAEKCQVSCPLLDPSFDNNRYA